MKMPRTGQGAIAQAAFESAAKAFKGQGWPPKTWENLPVETKLAWLKIAESVIKADKKHQRDWDKYLASL